MNTSMFNLNLRECAELIMAIGTETTVLLQGPTGVGKSDVQKTLASWLPTHVPVYFDCTTKDLGDVALPHVEGIATGDTFVRMVSNEELGLHHHKPIILMIDELGKANPAVRDALSRLIYERKMGSYTLHPDSIVFATTNLAAENLGDMLKPHQWNRLTWVTVRKPTHLEWLEWGINNGAESALLGWVRDNPQLFQSFEDVAKPEDNPYIHHPRDPSRKAFVTGRSLMRASKIIQRTRGKVTDNVLTAALIGTIGARAAVDLMAFVQLIDDLPTLESIKRDPKTAKVPQSASAVCMVVYRTLATLEPDWIDQWMIYLDRLDTEAQGLFANGVRAKDYRLQAPVMLNRSFTQWVTTRAYLFGADQ
jgi:AAA domain (dynein-related subfamily)